METTVPPRLNIVGLGFRPTDEELVDYYLKRRLLLQDNPDVHLIPDIDLCNVEPCHVPEMLAKSVIRFKDPEWFFFSHVGYKYSNSKRFNRTTKCGFWKTTGKDRKIRTWDNTVIGTKKTLVFYEGRVPHGVKSNWVIHEYHADTFPENQRTFVLCRLMKRPEKKTKGGTDAVICDEGEPNRSMVSENENQTTAAGIPSEDTFTEIGTTFPAVHQTEEYFSSIYQSPTGIEQEQASFANIPICDAYFRNESNTIQTPPEIITMNDEFLNSLLADDIDDEECTVTDGERMHAFVNSSTQSKSLKRAHCESSGIDAEVISKLDGDIVNTSTRCIECHSSDEYHTSKRFKSSHDVYSDECLLSSNREANQESMFPDDFWGVETSSCDSTVDKPLEISCIEISSNSSTPRRWENQYIQDQTTTSYDGN